MRVFILLLKASKWKLRSSDHSTSPRLANISGKAHRFGQRAIHNSAELSPCRKMIKRTFVIVEPGVPVAAEPKVRFSA